MKTAEEIILEFKELPPEEWDKVVEYVDSVKEQEETNFLNQAFEEEYVEEENYSPEDIALLDRLQEEAEQGINMSGPFVGEEAINYLRRLRKAKF